MDQFMDYAWGTWLWSSKVRAGLVGTMPRGPACVLCPGAQPWFLVFPWFSGQSLDDPSLWSQPLVPTGLSCCGNDGIVGMMDFIQHQEIPTLRFCCKPWLDMFQRCWTMKWIEMDNWLTLRYSTLVYHQQLKSDMSAIVIKRIIITNCTRGNRNGLFIYLYIYDIIWL